MPAPGAAHPFPLVSARPGARGGKTSGLFGCHPLFSCPLPWRDGEEGLMSRLPLGQATGGSPITGAAHTGCRPVPGTTTCPGPARRSCGRSALRARPSCQWFPRSGRSPQSGEPSSGRGPCPTGEIRGNISSSCLLLPLLVWAQRLPGGGELFYGSGQAPSWRIHGAGLGLHPSAQPGSPAGGMRLSPRRLAPHSWRQGVKCRALKSSHPLSSALASEEQGEGGEVLGDDCRPPGPHPEWRPLSPQAPALSPGERRECAVLLASQNN